LVFIPSDRPLLTCDALAERTGGPAGGSQHVVTDAAGGATALVIRALRHARPGPVVAITRHADDARALAADIGFTLGPGVRVLLFEHGEQSPYAHVVPDRRAGHVRLATLFELAATTASNGNAGAPPIIVVPAPALIRLVVPAAVVRARSQRLALFEDVDRERLIHQLTDAGYLRVPLVEDPGTVSVRGALVDVWPPGVAVPARVELDGDTIASIKSFDPDDQRSRDELEVLWLPPAREAATDRARLARASETLRELCDAVDWPSSKTRALIDDVVHTRAFFGGDSFLPALTELAPLHEQLPSDATIVLEEPSAIADAIEQERTRAESDALEKHDEPHFPVEAFYTDAAALDRWLRARTTVALNSAPIIGESNGDLIGELARVEDDTPSLAMHDQSELTRTLAAARKGLGHAASLEPLVTRIRDWQEQGLRVVFSARASTQAERLARMLENRELTVTTVLDDADAKALLSRPRGQAETQQTLVVVGQLARGTVAMAEGLALITEEEVFGSRAHRRKAKRTGKRKTRQLLEDLRSLTVGDFVVHVEHGIGRYEGLLHRQVGKHTVDLLAVSYAGGDKLYLPVYRLNQLHKLRGADATPKLDRLGGQSFARSKSRAKKKVRQIADELLRLYAERQATEGEVTPPVDDEYRAFEATFPFEETDDQARAITEVGADLDAARPMDRLVCGDVGFGKTEVALRAAFRVAMSGRQVAVLCPTTVLAQQHKMTFDSRLNSYPIEVGVLSRFRSKREQDATIRGLRDGTVDVVIGTHRLLSKDVHFKHLGLLVVDEEQRFGVTHKERIKALKTNVDVLALSATPIPRTLQMAISGIRDLSIMTTAPADRRAVRTIVTRNDPSVLRQAMERELSRGGQIFFVYNRIAGLEERAALVQQLAPEARIAVAHGRLNEGALERIMLEFVEGHYDVLVTTAIIENGLDIPRCNTIIIDHAEMFGLSQLYQLRGRVGRSRERAYCYLVLPPGGAIGDDARARLEALQRYTELGSGFQIASLDLDLRGAGDMLGAEQSGAVASVGFDMFCSMLEETVAELRGDPVTHDVDPELSFDVEALLPERYVPDVGVRLSLYKRLASAHDIDEVQALSEEMQDRFGRPPPEARRLVHLMTLKTELRKLRVLGCEASTKSVTLHLRDDTPLDPVKLTALFKKSDAGYRLTPDLRLSRRAHPGEVFDSGLEATDNLLSEIASCV
jgi:transcription-repair coupling factor (superfamily II helicase)